MRASFAVLPGADACRRARVARCRRPSPRRLHAPERRILVEVDTGKVLRAENATYPWYPASVTKLMTLYVTLQAIRDHRITLRYVFTVSPNALAQAPTKMGFPSAPRSRSTTPSR